MRTISLIILVLLALYNSNSEINIPGAKNTDNSLSECLYQMKARFFTTFSRSTYFISIDGKLDDEVFRKLYRTESLNKIIKLSDYTVEWYTGEGRRYAVVIMKNFQEIMKEEYISKLVWWNARARYIFVATDNSKEYLKKFVEILWDKYLMNSILMMPSLNDEEKFEIFSWFPYEFGQCGKNIVPRLINECKNGTFKENVELFPDKLPLNLNGCPLVVRTMIWPPAVIYEQENQIITNVPLNIKEGTEVQLVNTISQVANFKVIYTSSNVPQDWGQMFANGSGTGMVGAVKRKEADLCIGSIGTTKERIMFLDVTYCHYQDGITSCVPIAQLAPRWKSIANTFKLSAWLAMAATFVLVSILSWVLSICSPRDTRSAFTDLADSLQYNFTIFLSLSSAFLPYKASVRLFFFVWVIFGLHFTIAYQAKLISVLTQTTYDDQLDNLEEMLTSDLKIYLMPTFKRFFGDTDDWRVRLILEKWDNCYNATACMQRMAVHRNISFFVTEMHVHFETLKYLDYDGRPMIFCLEKYLWYPSVAYMTKGHPLYERFNSLIMKIRDSGFVFKWLGDIANIYKERYKKKSASSDGGQPSVLTREHLEGAFLILFLGCCIAFLSFICEIIFKKCKDKWNKKKSQTTFILQKNNK